MSQSDGSDIFGPGRTWWQVYKYTMQFSRKTWPGAPPEVIRDSVGDAVTRTMDLWVHWKGSVVPGNGALTMAGAKRHACMEAHKYIKKELARENQQMFAGVSSNNLKDPLTDKAQDVIQALQADSREWEGWARDFLEGLTQEETASKEGVSHQAISRRRARGLQRIAPLLEEHGLNGGTEWVCFKSVT